MVEIKFKKLHPNAKIPAFAKKWDAGFDLSYCGSDYNLSPGERKLFGTGLCVEVPNRYEMQIRPRSGLSFKQGVTVLNTPGTIDSGYRGEVGIILINHGSENYLVKSGERIAQGVIGRLEEVSLVETDELSESERSVGGFGSTGVR
ncbi:MAG: dUTP diphosphatase [Nanoarchaeota archaeon]|nr:dUTP diphosphatase [Nanoarchaeota archaeon]